MFKTKTLPKRNDFYHYGKIESLGNIVFLLLNL